MNWQTKIVGILVTTFVLGCQKPVEEATSIKVDDGGATKSTSAAAKPETAKKSPAPKVADDDADAVAAIKDLTDKIRTDGNGNIIDIDLRGKTISDADLEPIGKLKKLRALRLAGTPISDASLETVGKIQSLEDLDLRDCGISDSGLLHLASLPKLKALRLSGKSGACSVSDDGMEHVAKICLLYTSPSPRDLSTPRMPSSA